MILQTCVDHDPRRAFFILIQNVKPRSNWDLKLCIVSVHYFHFLLTYIDTNIHTFVDNDPRIDFRVNGSRSNLDFKLCTKFVEIFTKFTTEEPTDRAMIGKRHGPSLFVRSLIDMTGGKKYGTSQIHRKRNMYIQSTIYCVLDHLKVTIYTTTVSISLTLFQFRFSGYEKAFK